VRLVTSDGVRGTRGGLGGDFVIETGEVRTEEGELLRGEGAEVLEGDVGGEGLSVDWEGVDAWRGGVGRFDDVHLVDLFRVHGAA